MAFQQKIGEPHQFDLKFVTWNYGPTGPKSASMRYTIVPLFFRQIKEKAFICHQEVTVQDETAREIFFYNESEEKYFYQSRKERGGGSTRQAISFPKPYIFIFEEYNVESNRVSSDKATVGRYYSRLITVTRGKYGVRFVLVSLHARYKVKNSKKEEYLKEFLKKMCKYADEEKVPVIVGGDFNFNVKEWRGKIIKEYEGRVDVAPLYNGVPGRPHSTKIIDTFLVVYPEFAQDIVKFHIPIPICPIPRRGYIGGKKTKLDNYDDNPNSKVLHYSDKDFRKVKKVIKEDYNDDRSVLQRLDHDPVMVTIEFIPIGCFYAVDKKWQLKACYKINLGLKNNEIKQSIKDEYRGDTSTPLRCPDFRSIWPRHTTDEYSLFHAFSYVITGSEEWYKKVHEEVFKHMYYIEDHLMGRCIDKHKYDDIYDYIANSKSTLGTKVEICTLAHLLETNIYVYFYRSRDKCDRSNGVWHRFQPKFVTSDMSVYITNHYEVVKKQRKQ